MHPGRRWTGTEPKIGGRFSAKRRLWLAAAISLVLLACSGSNSNVGELLLHPDDFPGLAVTETSAESTATPQGYPVAQVELDGPDFKLDQSVVLFATGEQALSVLEGIKRDQETQGITPAPDTGQFQDSSGILVETRGDKEILSLFFVEGRALVRVTMAGANADALLDKYAELARSKVDRQ